MLFVVIATHSFGTTPTVPESVRDFWLGWGAESMSGHYDGIKSDVAYRRDVAETCGVGFDVPATLGAIEPKLEPHTVTAST